MLFRSDISLSGTCTFTVVIGSNGADGAYHSDGGWENGSNGTSSSFVTISGSPAVSMTGLGGSGGGAGQGGGCGGGGTGGSGGTASGGTVNITGGSGGTGGGSDGTPGAQGSLPYSFPAGITRGVTIQVLEVDSSVTQVKYI